MRITFVNGLYPPHGNAGAENSLRLLAAGLARRGHDCAVLTLTPEPRPGEGEVDGIAADYLPLANVYWPHGPRRPRLLRPVFQLLDAFNPLMLGPVARALARRRPDVVNCHNLQGFSVAAWLAARRCGVPVVQTLHDYYLGCPRSAMWRPGRGNCARPCVECRAFALPRRRLSRIPAAVTAVSHRLFDRLAAAGVFPDAVRGAQPVRIIRGNNAPLDLPSEPAAPAGGAFRIGFMGRLEPTKGLENLIDAMHAFPEGAASLTVAGRGRPDYVAALRARAAGSGAIAFLGHVRPADFFPAIDLLVIPSVWEDPFPRVFHEALAYGVPSLVSPLGGLREVIRPGQTGFVADGADAVSLRAALGALVAQGWDRAAMRARCRAAAAAFDADRIAGQYEAVLHAAAARAPIPEEAGEVWRGPLASPPPRAAAREVLHGA
jgi:glycosyltransferase involved in cell wall biosynthesis